MQMSKKNLLNENTVRRFMTLAGNNKYTSNFINETWSQNAAGLEEGLYEDDLEEGGMGMYEDDLEEGGMGMYEDDLEEGHGMFEDEMEEDLYEQDMIPGEFPVEDDLGMPDVDSLGLDPVGMGPDFYADDMSDPMMSLYESLELDEDIFLEQGEEDDMDLGGEEEDPGVDAGGEEPAGDVDVEIEEDDVDCLRTARDVLDSIISAAGAEAGAEDEGGEDLDMGGEEEGGEELDLGGGEEPAPEAPAGAEDEEALQEITNEVLKRVTRRLIRNSIRK
jgi:hypothetical protein